MIPQRYIQEWKKTKQKLQNTISIHNKNLIK